MESAEDIQALIRERILEYRHQRAHMTGHLKYLVGHTNDLHGIEDTASDLRDIDAAILALEEFAGPSLPHPGPVP